MHGKSKKTRKMIVVSFFFFTFGHSFLIQEFCETAFCECVTVLNMDMKRLLLALGTCICISIMGCQRRASVDDRYQSVDDVPQQNIVFVKAGPKCLVKGKGSFAVVHDTVFFVDYYYDYNDSKELTLFSLRDGRKERLIDRYKSGPIELGCSDRRLSLFRRGWRASYKEYSLDSIHVHKVVCTDSISIQDIDHIQKAEGLYICAKVTGGGPHIVDVYDAMGKLVDNVDPYDGLLDSIPNPNDRYILGQGFLGYNKKGRYVVFSSIYMGIIRLYDIVDNKLVTKRTYYIGSGVPDVLKFNVTNGTKIISEAICNDSEYVYILYKNSRVSDKIKYNYILRLDKEGNLDCLKANVDLVQLNAANGKLYGIAKYGKLGNVLVTAKLPHAKK